MSVSKKSNLNDCNRKVGDILYKGMVEMASAVVKQAQDNANKTPPGHPQVQTGTLRRSINMDVFKSLDGKQIIGKVGLLKGKTEGDVLVYGPVLELGRRDKTMPPYPYLYPAAKSVTANVGKYFKRAR